MTTVARLARSVDHRLFLRRRPLPLTMTAGRRAELRRVLDGMRDYNRVMCESAPGASLLELNGVTAAVIPTVPDVALMNNVVYEHAAGLATALAPVADAYEQAAVTVWIVYVPPTDREARRLLRRAGHRLKGSGNAMIMDLARLQRPSDDFLEDWTGNGDTAAMAAVIDRGFNLEGAHARTFPDGVPARVKIYLARSNGRPVSCVLTSDHEGNCAVHLTATLPEARGSGVAGALLTHALAEAVERGCTTSTVASGRYSRPLYERAGYRAVSPLQKWERRTTSRPPRRARATSGLSPERLRRTGR